MFCDVDDFCKVFLPVWQNRLLTSGAMQRQRERSLSISEIMTILIYFHQSHDRHFKAYYTEHVLKHLRSEFPGLVSYTRFVEWIPSVLAPLCVYDRGELLNLLLTPGHVDDRKPVPKLAHQLFGKLSGDKGYLSKALRDELLRTLGVELVTGIRSNMKNVPMPLMDKILLRKRAIIETIIDPLKNISQIEHSRHHSPINFLVNLLCGLIAYCRRPKKPSLGLGTLPALVA
ncbi:MAG: hypothetical protein KatS3mg049_1275 [Caldilinea sp.]|uniref:Putative transposase n=1 Tax=Caldilinea aerophila (strain DSM 14535 / JCM 11387 / NBRC 104270 / STL-6-O1) TaxID=926550 RepID=I0I7Z1_CALAS|nr:putative transposase [Caldilinea aerophila DSM 14535 = NBRC 104270]GIV72719.1 MAG: hypothetical protein KatS3mg049_1275 [Caldilinea sp.]